MNKIEAQRILGLSGSYSEVDLKRAYRNMATRCHPDVGGNADLFNMVNTAYEYLKVHSGGTRMQITHISLFNIQRRGSNG